MFYLMKKKLPIKSPSGYYLKIMISGYRQNNFRLKNNLIYKYFLRALLAFSADEMGLFKII